MTTGPGSVLLGPVATLEDCFPPFSLHVTCGPLSLSCLRDEDIPAVLQTAQDGVEPEDGPMPFLLPWHREKNIFVESSRYYWQCRATFAPENWALMLVVRHANFGDRPLGMQDIVATDFPNRRLAKTGSWLGLEFQGQGIGTLMRQAMATFAFDQLGAEVLESGYIAGNARSAAVSRKTGYRDLDDPTARITRGDGFVVEHRVVLTPDALVRPPHPVVCEGVPQLHRFMGLDAPVDPLGHMIKE